MYCPTPPLPWLSPPITILGTLLAMLYNRKQYLDFQILKVQVFTTTDRQCLHVISSFFFFFFRQPAENLQVALGKQNLKKRENQEQIFEVEKVIVHYKYREKDGVPHNDIGKSLLLNIHAAHLQPQFFEHLFPTQVNVKFPLRLYSGNN